MWIPLVFAVAAAATDQDCRTVRACVALAAKSPEEFTAELEPRLRALPPAVLIDGWAWKAADPKVVARVRELVERAVEGLGTEDLEDGTVARKYLRFVLARARERGVDGDGVDDLDHSLITLRYSSWASLLDGCAGTDDVGRRCAEWAAATGSSAPAVVEAMWTLALTGRLSPYPGASALVRSAPLRERVMERCEGLRARNAALTDTDAELLVAVGEPRSFELLAFWVRHPARDHALPALKALVADRIGHESVSPLQREAAWRALDFPEIERSAALSVLAAEVRGARLDEAERARLVALAASADDARQALAAALARFAHLDDAARALVVKEAFSPDRTYSLWSALADIPETTCWLTAPTRAWLEQHGDALGALDTMAEWVDAHWNRKLREEAGTEARTELGMAEPSRSWACGTGYLQAAEDAEADRAAFGLPPRPVERRPVPAPAPRFDRRASQREYEAFRKLYLNKLYQKMLATLKGPPATTGVVCTAPQPPSPAHATGRPLEPGDEPSFTLFSPFAHARVHLRAPNGAETALLETTATSGAAVRPFLPPVRADDWWHGPGNYEASIEFDDDPKPKVLELSLAADTRGCRAEFAVAVGAGAIRCHRRAPAEVVLRVTGDPLHLELTITNGTSDTLVTGGEAWRDQVDLTFVGSGPQPTRWLGARPPETEPIPPGTSRTMTFDFHRAPLAAGKWTAQLRYRIAGTEGQDFMTDEQPFALAPSTDPRAAVLRALSAAGGLPAYVLAPDAPAAPK